MSVRQDPLAFACHPRRSALASSGVIVASLLAATVAWAGPKIDVAAPTRAGNGDLRIVARITAKGKVFQPYLCYRTTRDDFKVVPLKKAGGIDWTGTIPARDLLGSKVEYYLGAYDANDLSEGLWHNKVAPATMALESRSAHGSSDAQRAQNSGGYSDDATVATGTSLEKAPTAAPPAAEAPPVFVPAPAAKTAKAAPVPKLAKAPKQAKPAKAPKPAPVARVEPKPKPAKKTPPPKVAVAKTAHAPKKGKKSAAPATAEKKEKEEDAGDAVEIAMAPPDHEKQEEAPAPVEAVKPVAPPAETPLTVTGLPPNQGYLRVLTEPARAVVGIDGLDVGPGPVNKAIAAGEYLISAHLAGYRDESRVVSISAGAGKQIRLKLQAK